MKHLILASFGFVAALLIYTNFVQSEDSSSSPIPEKALMNHSKSSTHSGQIEIALLAGGCFWGVEELIRQLDGVIETEVGYTGGHFDQPTYKDVKTGATGHAEAVQIKFDPKKISYEEILRFFFRLHDPTTTNQQGNDIGSQYRSAVYFQNDAQKLIAEKIKSEVNQSGKWARPVVTEIASALTFYSAEPEHQDYLQRFPDGYTCHFLRD